MVVFVCNYCGDSLKKQVVQKHYQQKCQGAKKSVSCIDCLKDFYNEDYDAHIKCITEAEKYSGANYVPKEQKNAKKQETWTDIVVSILKTGEYELTPQLRIAFERLGTYTNVPQKKAKFENFIRNSLHMSNAEAAGVWNILEKELEKMKQARALRTQQETAAREAKKQNTAEKRAAPKTENEQPPTKKVKSKKDAPATVETNGDEDAKAENEQPTTKKVKSKKDAPATVETNGDEDAIDFDWNAILLKIVSKHGDGGLSLDKLKEKVRARYFKKTGIDESNEELNRKFVKKFNKKLKKCAELQRTDNDLVKLCQGA